MSGDLEGRVALVTAAASGIGRETSLAFAKAGAHVVVVDINADAAAAVVGEIERDGGSAEAIRVDMTQVAEIDDAVAQVERKHHRLDVLYNHVGGPAPRGFDFDEAAWRRAVDLNLTAPIFMTKAALPLMRDGDRGSILFTSSVAGLVASPNSPIYSALKTGVIGFMRTVASAGAASNIRANAICPGTTDTPMLPKFFTGPGDTEDSVAERIATFVKTIPMGRYCRPDEVAQLALFLASDRSSFITGAAIPVDGGFVAL